MSERLTCLFCGAAARLDRPDGFATFRCSVRAFLGERFRVWRCPGCRTLHCAEVVDLARYYGPYPFKKARLAWPLPTLYRNLLSRVTRHGLRRESRLLDYGCGNGLFVQFLRQRGHPHVDGYDPYADPAAFGDPVALSRGPFDYILLQDVIEHVEDPAALLAEMDRHLAPAGHILVGTPNADRIDLAHPERYLNEVHVPYHLHILTRERLESLGRDRGWQPVDFWSRGYHDYPFMGLNARAGREYQRLMDDSLDALFDPPQIGKAIRSPRYMFHAVFGWLLSFKADMAVMFRKPGATPNS